jgi:plasmid stabilization system protein ParE
LKTVVFVPQAHRELREAAARHERQSPGLGQKLILEVDRALELVVQNPEAFPRWQADCPYRKVVLKHFPYLLFFSEHSDTLRVLAIAHSRRRPGYWIGRG